MSRLARVFAVFGLVATSSLVAFGGSAMAGDVVPIPTPENSLTILKTVDGPVTAGTTFTVTVTCTKNVIDDGEEGTNTATVKFDSAGQPTTQSVLDLLSTTGTCTVTETQNGGAASTTYECEGHANATPSATAVLLPVCPQAGPIAGPITVDKPFLAIEATVTVHNTFVAKPVDPVIPAAQVVAQHTFTG